MEKMISKLKWPNFKKETKTVFVIMKMITGFEQR